MSNYLTQDFLLEFFRLLFIKKTVLEIAHEHFKYQFIPKEWEGLKKIFKTVDAFFVNHDEVPSLGYVSQMHNQDDDVQNFIAKIKETTIADVDIILLQLEEYIKTSRFELMYAKGKEIYERGEDKQAIDFIREESEEITNFSVTSDTRYFKRIFKDFDERVKKKNELREVGAFDWDKVPFSIVELDDPTDNGIDRKDTVCFLARSGVGKSTVLRYIAMNATRLGFDVLHVQAEGSEQECLDKFDQMWAKQDYRSVKYLNLDNALLDKLHKISRQMLARDKDLYVYSFEMFDEASCKDIRELILKYIKERGKAPDLITVDSLDLLHPGDGVKYGVDTQSVKMKKENSARKLKNLCIEFDTRIVTADKADNIPKENWNNPDWVMNHSNSSGSKNIDSPFSYYITINQTEDERKAGIARLFMEKMRNYHIDDRVARIATKYEHGIFYDAVRTRNLENLPETKITKPKLRSKNGTKGK